MWAVWAVSSVACFIVYFKEHLYTNMIIQVYFFFAAIYGFIHWHNEEKVNEAAGIKPADEREIIIHPFDVKKGIISIAISVVVFFVLAFLYIKVFPSELSNGSPWLDPLCATFSMLATYWLSQSWIEEWYIWFGVNALSVWMYMQTKMYPFAVLYFFLFLTVINGILNWKKHGRVVPVERKVKSSQNAR
jgi:nicotinamide mononucleotide transporter